MLRSFTARAADWLRGPRELPAPVPPRPFPPGAFIAFVLPVEAAMRVNQTDRYAPIIASMRLRATIPARQLAQRVPVWFVPIKDFVRDPGLSGLGTVGAVVICKMPSPNIVQRQAVSTELLARAAAERGGVPLYADVPDDLAALGRAIDEPYLARYQKGLGASCTLLVPTRALGEDVARDARRGIVVIEDPYENRARPVRATASSPLRLMWFGNIWSVSAAQLGEALARVVGAFRELPLRLEMVTRTDERHLLDAIGARLRAVHPQCDFRVTAWSLQAAEDALERCDFVLIPQELRKDWSRGKSHNRLVAAIRGGRLAIASPIPAYRELADYAWIGEDLAAGLRWALAHPDEAAQRVTAGQRVVEERFSPESIGRKWAAALGIA